ncbi:GNAT family N-acetyltransferase [Bacillus suaedaesalsae]|uniref:GNAT family N-acetyltransferase n=1 Tax=Bacillus suaedaesalsae TaxID=2810349 RepID=A0ABS2DET1_9BACI|nr:GNAT family N-acetyltransferase [Bacillus suaedaesalsae]MBM6616962.1 GNAT family N-acetyltransferase [Bacillus suaedaesalsae]
MSTYIVKALTQEERPTLGKFYETVALDKKVVFWWIGSEENWENVICAFENGEMIAKGQVQVVNTIPDGHPPSSKHKIYLNLKTLPDRETDVELLNSVYDKLYERALVLKQELSPNYETDFCVGNFGTEVNNNCYFLEEKGFKPQNTLYTMERDLTQPIVNIEFPESELRWNYWSMETAQEEKQYLDAECIIWPDIALGYNRLREYKNHNYWTAITVWGNDDIIASVMAWEKEGIGVIEDVFVMKQWRKHGIARFLLTTALTYLNEKGLSEAELMVDTANEKALNLYKSVGFEVVEVEKRFYTELV